MAKRVTKTVPPTASELFGNFTRRMERAVDDYRLIHAFPIDDRMAQARFFDRMFGYAPLCRHAEDRWAALDRLQSWVRDNPDAALRDNYHPRAWNLADEPAAELIRVLLRIPGIGGEVHRPAVYMTLRTVTLYPRCLEDPVPSFEIGSRMASGAIHMDGLGGTRTADLVAASVQDRTMLEAIRTWALESLALQSAANEAVYDLRLMLDHCPTIRAAFDLLPGLAPIWQAAHQLTTDPFAMLPKASAKDAVNMHELRRRVDDWSSRWGRARPLLVAMLAAGVPRPTLPLEIAVARHMRDGYGDVLVTIPENVPESQPEHA